MLNLRSFFMITEVRLKALKLGDTELSIMARHAIIIKFFGISKTKKHPFLLTLFYLKNNKTPTLLFNHLTILDDADFFVAADLIERYFTSTRGGISGISSSIDDLDSFSIEKRTRLQALVHHIVSKNNIYFLEDNNRTLNNSLLIHDREILYRNGYYDIADTLNIPASLSTMSDWLMIGKTFDRHNIHNLKIKTIAENLIYFWASLNQVDQARIIQHFYSDLLCALDDPSSIKFWLAYQGLTPITAISKYNLLSDKSRASLLDLIST